MEQKLSLGIRRFQLTVLNKGIERDCEYLVSVQWSSVSGVGLECPSGTVAATVLCRYYTTSAGRDNGACGVDGASPAM